MPYDTDKPADMKSMKDKLSETYASVSDTAARQAIHVWNSVMDESGDEGQAWASVYSVLNKRGLSKKGGLAQDLERIASKHPKHAETLQALAREVEGASDNRDLLKARQLVTEAMNKMDMAARLRLPPPQRHISGEINHAAEVLANVWSMMEEMIPRRSAMWLPGELRDPTVGDGEKHPNEIIDLSDGSQVPPARDNEGHLIEASVEDEWAALAKQTRR